MGPDNLSSIRDADRYRSEGPTRRLINERDMKVVSKDEAKEDEQKKKKNVGDKEKFEKAANLANLKAAQKGEAKEKTQSPTLFDLAKGDKKGEIKPEEETAFNESAIKDSPAPIQEDETLYTAEEPKKKMAGPFIQEQPDLSYVNPMPKTELASIYTPSQPIHQPQVDMVQRIKEIVDQISKADLYSIKDGGKTETVVVLKDIKMFEGAKVIVTSFDSAKHEFNISFENLSQQAKNLLDLPQNREALMQALAQKGEWVVHQVITTTLDNRPYVQPDSSKREQSGREQDAQDAEDRKHRR